MPQFDGAEATVAVRSSNRERTFENETVQTLLALGWLRRTASAQMPRQLRLSLCDGLIASGRAGRSRCRSVQDVCTDDSATKDGLMIVMIFHSSPVLHNEAAHWRSPLTRKECSEACNGR